MKARVIGGSRSHSFTQVTTTGPVETRTETRAPYRTSARQATICISHLPPAIATIALTVVITCAGLCPPRSSLPPSLTPSHTPSLSTLPSPLVSPTYSVRELQWFSLKSL